MADTLRDQVAVVTGASTGIGFAIAKRFAAEGAQVYLTGRRQDKLDEAVRRIGRDAIGVRCDVSQLDDLDALYDQVGARSGRIDVLAANAGGGAGGPLGTVTEQQFDATFATNVKGMFFTVQKALPLLPDGARVILTGSTSGVKAMPGASVYAASKASVRNFARTWIVELAPRGIRVNVLTPGPVRTPGLEGIGRPEDREGTLAAFAAAVPLGRLGDPDEIGNVALFLASEQASFLNGAEVFADGGQAQV